MYIVSFVLSKPANAIWYNEVSLAAAANVSTYNNFRKSCSGFISRTVSNYNPNTNSYTVTSRWVNESAYQAFIAARESLQSYQEIIAYNTANNITVIRS